ncbi:hypothetical protein [Streptomyces sp. NBC_00005]|uniref:hypothetical protein n=1 Tax=Streptomyces sp. NBC_00005 TaxID=2903609 RepID=UPI003245BFC1
MIPHPRHRAVHEGAPRTRQFGRFRRVDVRRDAVHEMAQAHSGAAAPCVRGSRRYAVQVPSKVTRTSAMRA